MAQPLLEGPSSAVVEAEEDQKEELPLFVQGEAPKSELAENSDVDDAEFEDVWNLGNPGMLSTSTVEMHEADGENQN